VKNDGLPLLPSQNAAGYGSDISKLIPARSAMVLFFHCSFRNIILSFLNLLEIYPPWQGDIRVVIAF
jgi:hypothetical protein